MTDAATQAGALLLSPKNLAFELGVSARTVRRLDMQGKLPMPIHVGRAVRWRRDEIRRWIDAGAPDRETWQAYR